MLCSAVYTIHKSCYTWVVMVFWLHEKLKLTITTFTLLLLYHHSVMFKQLQDVFCDQCFSVNLSFTHNLFGLYFYSFFYVSQNYFQQTSENNGVSHPAHTVIIKQFCRQLRVQVCAGNSTEALQTVNASLKKTV